MNNVTFQTKGKLDMTFNLLKHLLKLDPVGLMNKYGAIGVERLQQATPKDTGLTAASWYYTVDKTTTGYALNFHNDNRSEGIPIVILLFYGHGTRGGTWVEGLDFIHPALRPVFQELSEALRKEAAYGSKN